MIKIYIQQNTERKNIMSKKKNKTQILHEGENFYGFSKNCEDAMFYNPVASANDCTGYTMKVPLTKDEAEDKARLVNSPATKFKIKEKFE